MSYEVRLTKRAKCLLLIIAKSICLYSSSAKSGERWLKEMMKAIQRSISFHIGTALSKKSLGDP